jgi:hypothetical protein
MYSDLVSSEFIGREAELATLTTARETAVAGAPTVVLLGGEAGVGKTRLVEGRPRGRARPVRESSREAASSWAARGWHSARSRTHFGCSCGRQSGRQLLFRRLRL